MKTVGKETKNEFNAIMFESVNDNDKVTYMVGFFEEEEFDSDNRSGWLRYNTLKSDDLLDVMTSELVDIWGGRAQHGNTFKVYFASAPKEVETGKSKLRYDCRDIKMVGYNLS